jgi:hypothetical protein
MAAAHGRLEEEVGDEAAMCSEAGNQAMTCSRAGIVDGRWWRWLDRF